MSAHCVRGRSTPCQSKSSATTTTDRGTKRRRVAAALEHRVVSTVSRAFDGPRVRIDQQLARVEAVTVPRVPRAVHPEAVPLTGTATGDEAVPDVEGGVLQRDALLAAVVVEQADGHARGIRRPERDVDAVVGRGRPERMPAPRPRTRGAARSVGLLILPVR